MNKQNQSLFYGKPLSSMELHLLGIPDDNFKTVQTLDELRKTPSNIVIAECLEHVKFTQNKFNEQILTKKQKYVMSSGIYMQLHCDPRIKTKRKILKPSSIQFKNIHRQYFGHNLDNKTLLVIRQGGIGDLLFILPNLIYLKQKYPTCVIKVACGPQYKSMVQEWESVDEVLELPFIISELFQADYHCTFEGVIERCKEAETSCSYNLFSKWMGLDLPDELLIPSQTPNSEAVYRAKKAISDFKIHDKDFIVLQLRSSSPVRTPNPEIFSKLINRLTDDDYDIVIADSKNQSSNNSMFISKLKNKHKVHNFSEYSYLIADTIALTSLAKMSISIDSSLTHIAESLGIKSFTIMGPFPSNVRLTTYKNNDSIDVKRDKCSPCFIHGNQPCPESLIGYSPCYNNLDIDLCVEKIKSLWNK